MQANLIQTEMTSWSVIQVEKAKGPALSWDMVVLGLESRIHDAVEASPRVSSGRKGDLSPTFCHAHVIVSCYNCILYVSRKL